MKTQIIRLEPHDDAVSVKDKMGWGQTPRILLVWPNGSQILNRRLDLLFLKRHSATLGAKLALVASSSEVRDHANNLSIPVFASIRKAEEHHWRRSRRERRKKGSGERLLTTKRKKHTEQSKFNLINQRAIIRPQPNRWVTHPFIRILLFSVGVLGILAIGAILVPRAEIRLYPITKSEQIQIPVTAHRETQRVDLSGQVPARQVNVIVEGRGSRSASGSLTIPDLTATGKVAFTNLTDQEITIPTGTVVTTNGPDPIRFVTTAEGLVPPQAESQPIPIEALFPGTESNIKSGSIQAIEGPLGLNLTVTNNQRTSGGSFRPAPAPTEADYHQLLAQMVQTLHATALKELRTEVGQSAIPLYSDPQDFKVIAETYSPAEIQAADELQLTVRVEYQALVATESDLQALGAEVLAANIPDRFIGNPTSVSIEHLTAPKNNPDGTITWDLVASWQISAAFNENDAINLALWQTPTVAATRIAAELPVTQPKINMTPNWWPRLPILPFRVNVSIQP